ELRDATVVELLTRCDAFRRPERIPWLATVCEADKRGRGGSENADYPQGRALVRLHEAACRVGARDVVREGMTGPEIGAAVQAARVAAVHRARQTGG
ncbi:MAG: multifunctional CCA tRNA nucleotidyl transferase/2'3'-cyclic phosphodiesterase/2'nucleotidase/phosphatase, partial [Stenotrophomonas acidaminiphila]